MEHEVNASTAGSSGQIVVAGAGYAGLHVALRLMAKLRHHPAVELTLVDRHDYHQVLTELPRVAAGTRAADAVRIPLQDLLATRVRFVQTEITGFDLPARLLRGGAGPIGWTRLVLALGRPGPTTSPSRAWPSAPCRCTQPATPNECGTRSARPSTSGRWPPPVPDSSAAWPPWWSAAAAPPESRRCAGELAEILPKVRSHGLAPDRPAVQLVEAGPTILACFTAADRQGGRNPVRPGGPGPHQCDDRRRDPGGLPAHRWPAGGGRRVRLGGRVKAPAGGRFRVADRAQRPGQGRPVPARAGLPGNLRRRRPRLGDRSAHRARAAPAGAGGTGGG